MTTIPHRGLPHQDIFTAMEAYRRDDLAATSGRTWGYSYHPGEEAAEVAKKAFVQFMSLNALDPTTFPSLRRLENDIVAMTAHHMNGGPEVAGTFTSGGTESIILAVKAARDHARTHRPHIQEPEIVLPVTGHASFHKAAHYLGLNVVLVPVDRQTFKADVGAMRDAITPNTVLLVGSAPSYAHGVVDPIGEIGALALEHELLLHVDACIGGFLLPYFEQLGAKVPRFDFRVPGVSSISLDLHKYGYAPKGASVLLCRDQELRSHQLYACADWTGYSLVNTTIQSSKSGGPLAGAWAVLHHLGHEGYLELARQVYHSTGQIVAGIEAMADLQVLGQPEMSLIAVASDTVNIFQLVDRMAQRGWYLQPQLAYAGSPENFHLTVTPQNVGAVEDLLRDLARSVADVKGVATEPILPPEMVAGLAAIRPEELDDDALSGMLGMAGVQRGELPKELAGVNGIMNTLPAPLRAALLKAFWSQLFSQPERRPVASLAAV